MRRWLSWQLQKLLPDPGVSFHRLEIEKAVFDDLDWSPMERVLDVGCYHGEYAQRLSDRVREVVACDINVECLSSLIRGPVLATAASAYHLPFPSASFDTVLAQNLVVLLDRPAEALREFVRCCAPGGRIILTLNNTRAPFSLANRWAERLWPGCPWATIRPSRNVWSAERWIDQARRKGVDLERVHSCNLCWPLVHRVRGVWLIPNRVMWWWSRRVRRWSGKPLETSRPHFAAHDYVLTFRKPPVAASFHAPASVGTIRECVPA